MPIPPVLRSLLTTTGPSGYESAPAAMWREAAGGYGEEGVYKSVADVTGQEALDRVRAYKKEMKAAAKA